MLQKIAQFFLASLIPQTIIGVTYIVLAKYIDKIDFAALMLIDSIFQFFVIIFLFGNDKAIERFVPEKKTSQYERSQYIVGPYIAVSFFLLVFIVISDQIHAVVYALTGVDLYGGYSVSLVLLASCGAAMLQLTVSMKHAELDSMAVLYLKMLRAVLFSMSIYLGFKYASDIKSVKVISDIASTVGVVLLFFVLSRSYGLFIAGASIIIKSIRVMRGNLGYTVPFVVTILSSFALNNADRFVINEYYGLDELSDYALSQRIGAIFLLISSGIAAIVPPYFYRNFHEDKSKSYLMSDNIINVLVYVSIIFTITTVIAFPEIFGKKYPNATLYLAGLVLGGFISVAVSYGTALCLLYDKRSIINMSTGLIGGVFNIASLYLLVPTFGVIGAVLSYVSSLALVFMLQFLYIRKSHPSFPFGFSRMLSVASILLLVMYVEHSSIDVGVLGYLIYVIVLLYCVMKLIKQIFVIRMSYV